LAKDWHVEENFENAKDIGLDQDARAEIYRLVQALFGMLLRHSPNNARYWE
jgi:hypothetical protein